MAVEEVVAPEIDVPVLEGGVVTGTGAWAYQDACPHDYHYQKSHNVDCSRYDR